MKTFFQAMDDPSTSIARRAVGDTRARLALWKR